MPTDTDPLTVDVKIDNVYEDGYEFTSYVTVPAPSAEDDLETDVWWEEHIWEQTGGREGPDASLDAGYFAEIIKADDAALIGVKWEWV